MAGHDIEVTSYIQAKVEALSLAQDVPPSEIVGRAIELYEHLANAALHSRFQLVYVHPAEPEKLYVTRVPETAVVTVTPHGEDISSVSIPHRAVPTEVTRPSLRLVTELDQHRP
ncbi:MAG: hypothetical protein JWM81_1146 [Candidatus Saccharibacteria bacterium]|nr:hypothetical protein [Candidatus Saccharibacteria bacterium]